MIDISKYKPEQIRYDEKGVWTGEEFFPSDNPRLEFAKALEWFPQRFSREYLHEGLTVLINTIYGECVEIGINCTIGARGFGYEKDHNGVWYDIPHLGNVIIEPLVTIHNNVCIDRGVTGSTIIGHGTKIDNLVHIAHNVRIGANCLIVAGAVLGGSCEIGEGTFVGINASIKNKVKVGNNCVIGMGAVVTKDVPHGATVIGVNKIIK